MSLDFKYLECEGFEHHLNITYNTKFKDLSFDGKLLFYFEVLEWCKENIGEENFVLLSEYDAPGQPSEWYIHTVSEEDLVIFTLKFVSANER